MKIEAGESLVYSWMRHVMKCQIVQTNWKTSPSWELSNVDELESLFDEISDYFFDNHGIEVFKKSGLRQALQQVECDVIGTSGGEGGIELYAAEVAFHESGLNYGSKDVTIAKVLSKMARIALCLMGYFGATTGAILFASPKINPAVLDLLDEHVAKLERMFQSHGLGFAFMIVANDDFSDEILGPVLKLGSVVADTSELFMRCYQLFSMYSDRNEKASSPSQSKRRMPRNVQEPLDHDDEYANLKVGKLANTEVRRILESGTISLEEIDLMTTKEYSFDTFHLSRPVLVRSRDSSNDVRYYVNPLSIRGTRYYLCSQWVERSDLNHRPYLLAWIRKHRID